MRFRNGYDQFLFIDADIGFDPADALRLLARPEPVVAGIYVHNKGRDFAGTFAPGVDRVVFGPGAPGLYPMLYAPTGFLKIRAEVLTRMIDELELPECHWGSIKGIYPFFLAAVRAGRTRRDAIPHRRLQLLAPTGADRCHADGRHDDQARPLQEIWVQL